MRMSSVTKPGWPSECLSKSQFPSLSRSGLKVPGGVVGWDVVGLRPISVFSLSLSQAEQQYNEIPVGS